MIQKYPKQLKSDTKFQKFLEGCVALLSNSVSPVARFSIPSFSSPLAFNDEMQIFELTSRRGDVATWRRRDVAELLTSAFVDPTS